MTKPGGLAPRSEVGTVAAALLPIASEPENTLPVSEGYGTRYCVQA